MESLAIISLAIEIARICRRLERCRNSLKTSKADIERLWNEATTSSELLQSFQFVIDKSKEFNDGFSQRIQKSVVPSIVGDGNNLVRKVELLLHRLRPLRSDKSSPFFATWIAKYRWLGCKQEVSELLIHFSCIKSSASLLTNQIQLDLTLESLRDCKATQSDLFSVPKEMIEIMYVRLGSVFLVYLVSALV
jgi:hypothetical protein